MLAPEPGAAETDIRPQCLGDGILWSRVEIERFTTIVVPPGWTVKLDKLGTYVGSSK